MSADLPEDARGLLSFIASTLEGMRATMATKADWQALRADVAAVRVGVECAQRRLDSIEGVGSTFSG